MNNPHRYHWALNPEVDFLNHGSFGATPSVVLDAQRDWITRLERDPIEFLAPERSLLPKLAQVRQCLGQRFGANPDDLALVRSATDGVNAVIGSFPLARGDEVVITNHGYNACNNAIHYAAERANASVVVAEIPFPIGSPDQVIDAVLSCLTARTRLMIVDHVSSGTALVFPVAQLVEIAHDHGIRIMIDGAHASGMVPLDLTQLGADYYTANHHKWLCAPKASGFLHVQPAWQNEVRPRVISHGANTQQLGATRFLAEFNWTGTLDPSPVLTVPSAIEFIDGLRGDPMNANHELVVAGRNCLLEQLDIEQPAPNTMLGSMSTIPIKRWKVSPDALRQVQQDLYSKYRIEVPVFPIANGTHCVRISAQAYNDLDQYKRLASVLKSIVDG